MNIKNVSIGEIKYFEGKTKNRVSMKGKIFLNTAYVGYFMDDNPYGILEVFFIRDEYRKKLKEIAISFFEDYQNGLFGKKTPKKKTLKEKYKTMPIIGLIQELIELKKDYTLFKELKITNFVGCAILRNEKDALSIAPIREEKDITFFENNGCRIIKFFREESDFNFK